MPFCMIWFSLCKAERISYCLLISQKNSGEKEVDKVCNNNCREQKRVLLRETEGSPESVGGQPRLSSIQSLSLCDAMDCSMPGFPVHHQLPELAQTHVHELVVPTESGDHEFIMTPLLGSTMFIPGVPSTWNLGTGKADYWAHPG